MDTAALRQKILDLAIRGKLVPQDQNDEPASVLLERIRVEKQQMVKDGKLKAKDIKNDTIIFKGEDNLHYEKFQDGTIKCIEDEIPFEVPEGWGWCRLGSIIHVESGKGLTSKEMKNGNIPVYGGNGINGYHDKSMVSQETIVIGRVGFYCGSIHVTPENAWITDNAFITFYPEKSVLCDFLVLALKWMNLGKRTNGSAQPVVSGSKIYPLLFVLPPLSEQNRIAEKTNELFKFIDTVNEKISDVSVSIDSIKTKILDLAIRGKLVPQDPNDEPASVLLERIRAEKEELIKQGKIKRDKNESVIYKGDDNSYYERFFDGSTKCINEEIPFELPESWKWTRLNAFCPYGDCEKVDTKNIENDAWVLDLEDIEKNSGRILKFVCKGERKSISTKHKFSKGQLLYSKLRPYLNKVVLSPHDGYCTSEILPLTLYGKINTAYMQLFLMSDIFLSYVDILSYGVKMPRLGTADGKRAMIALPPLSEQQQIVERVHSVFEQINKIFISIS